MDDFLKQLRSLRRMGPMKQLLGLLPGVGQLLKDVHIEDKQLDRVEAMINSMTREERAKPDLINNPRKRRIAQGSGSDQGEVGQLVKQFGTINKLSRQMASMSAASKVKAVKELGAQGGLEGMMPGVTGLPGMRTRGSSFSASPKSRFKKRKR